MLDAAPGERGPTARAAPGCRLVAALPAPDSSPTGSGNRLWRVRDRRRPRRSVNYLYRHGRPIAYGYLRDRYPLADYQTVFATDPGSAEMPSAGRPFTPELVDRLVAGGVAVAPITLHTGVSSQDAGEAPQAEWFSVPARPRTWSTRLDGRPAG